MEPAKFEQGKRYFRAYASGTTRQITCPDCGGTGRLRVTFHDDTQVSIHCKNCALGYDPPTGLITTYDYTPAVTSILIDEFRYDGGKWSYIGINHEYVYEEDIFHTEEEALARANVMHQEMQQEEERRLNSKEKDTKSWAWNASYHRKEIKDLTRRIEYHKAKLSVAEIKAKK